jgi:hypothetical protein
MLFTVITIIFVSLLSIQISPMLICLFRTVIRVQVSEYRFQSTGFRVQVSEYRLQRQFFLVAYQAIGSYSRWNRLQSILLLRLGSIAHSPLIYN